jgi:hypothetical protein
LHFNQSQKSWQTAKLACLNNAVEKYWPRRISADVSAVFFDAMCFVYRFCASGREKENHELVDTEAGDA